MAQERIFNVFIYFDGGKASEYGMRHHMKDGSDEQKTKFLRLNVDPDFRVAKRFPLSRTFSPEEWLAYQRLANVLVMFAAGFVLYRAPTAPVCCVTSIVDGVPKIEISTDISPFQGEKVNIGNRGNMEDWLVKYTKEGEINLGQLIHDDYFSAIKLLFNARHIASCAKLLMSCIDTLAFVEFGDIPGNFQKWLDTYVDLTGIGVTAKELWEFRNSIVHMTNTASRAVLKGDAIPLIPFIGNSELGRLASSPKVKPLDFYGLIQAVSAGIGQWAHTYNIDRDKFIKFIERYDTIISDSRLATFIVTPMDGETFQKAKAP